MSKQFRGHCQCCGRQQAVVKGRMAKHGYTIKNGWFEGVCGGDCHEPMQRSRATADKIIASVRAEVKKLLEKADQVLAGKIKPTKVIRGHFKTAHEIDFADATAYEQAHAIECLNWNLRSRAKQGEDFAAGLQMIADQTHGAALIAVEKKEALEKIFGGDKKVTDDKIYTCLYAQHGRIYYSVERGERVFKGWMGIRSWRKMKSV